MTAWKNHSKPGFLSGRLEKYDWPRNYGRPVIITFNQEFFSAPFTTPGWWIPIAVYQQSPTAARLYEYITHKVHSGEFPVGIVKLCDRIGIQTKYLTKAFARIKSAIEELSKAGPPSS